MAVLYATTVSKATYSQIKSVAGTYAALKAKFTSYNDVLYYQEPSRSSGSASAFISLNLYASASGASTSSGSAQVQDDARTLYATASGQSTSSGSAAQRAALSLTGSAASTSTVSFSAIP